MFKRRVGAIAEYKAARRRLKREAAKVKPAVLMRPVRTPSGEWYVERYVAGLNPARTAGPFDTRDEAQGWIDETMTGASK